MEFIQIVLRFFFGRKRHKENKSRKLDGKNLRFLASKKKCRNRMFRHCGDDQGAAFGNRKLSRKFDQSFPRGDSVKSFDSSIPSHFPPLPHI